MTPGGGHDELAVRPRRRHGWLLALARSLLAVLPLLWLARTVDLHQVGQAIAGSRYLLLIGAECISFAALLVNAARWRVLMHAFRVKQPPSWLTLLSHIMGGIYLNSLPTGLVGDVVRGWRVADRCGGLTSAYTILFTERACGLTGLLLISATSLLWRRSGDGGLLIARALGIGTLLAVGLTLALFFGPALLKRLPGRESSIALVRRLRVIVDEIPAGPALTGLALAVLLSVLSQALAACSLAMTVRAVAPEADLVSVFRAIPPIILLLFVHITPAAIGQRETVFMLFLRPVGIAAPEVLAVSTLCFGLGMVIVVICGLVHLAGQRRSRSRTT
jgi:hypothetical protein